MSENNNRIPGQPGEDQLPAQNTPAEQSPEEILAQVNLDEMGFPSDLIDNLLSDLESDAVPATPEAAEKQEEQVTVPAEPTGPEETEAEPLSAAPEQPAADLEEILDQPVQPEEAATEDDAAEQTAVDALAEEAPVGPEEENGAAKENADEPAGEPSEGVPAEQAEEAVAEAAEPAEESEIPPIPEKALAVSDAGADPTAGMTLIERAQYHARMRRREQTRLRRENVHHGYPIHADPPGNCSGIPGSGAGSEQHACGLSAVLDCLSDHCTAGGGQSGKKLYAWQVL